MPAATEHRTGRPPKYPWDEWLDGRHAYLVEHGTHFDCSTTSFVQIMSREAKKRGMKALWEYGQGIRLEDAEELLIWAVPLED